MPQNSSLRGFSQEDSYKVAREDGTGWNTTKDVLIEICKRSASFEQALAVAQEWDQDNEPPWGVDLKYQVTRLWNFINSGEARSFNSLPVRKLHRPEKLEYEFAEAVVAKYGRGAAEKIRRAGRRCPNAAGALDFLFVGNPWIAVSWQDPADQYTIQRETLRGFEERFAWLSPNPFRQKQVKVGARWSMKCDANILERLYMVIEFDLKVHHGWGASIGRWNRAGLSALDVQGALFLWIAARTGLKPFMIVFSGAASYHGWYDVRGVPEDQLAKIVELALPLGGDPASLTPSQLFRMPGGTRLRRIDHKTTRVRQEVVFWNP